MRSQTAQRFTLLTAAILLVSATAAPGLSLHHCRMQGDRVSAADCCCDMDENPSATGCSDQTSSLPNDVMSLLASKCCTIDHQQPFSYDGQTIGATPLLLKILQAGFGLVSTPDPTLSLEDPANSISDYTRIRHSSGPPLFLSSHSFRC
jgi:hypothetical protein